MPSKRHPPRVIRPEAGSSRRTESSVVVLPQPDSPTSPRVWPGNTSNETSSRARGGLPCEAEKLRAQVPHAEERAPESSFLRQGSAQHDHVVAAFQVVHRKARVEHFLQHIAKKHTAQVTHTIAKPGGR